MEKIGINGKAGGYAQLLIVALVLVLFLSVIRASIFADVPEEKKVWFEVSFILLIALLGEYLVVYLKQPTVMVLLVLGVVISPSAVSIVYSAASPIIQQVFEALGMTIQVNETMPHLVPTEGFIRIFAQLGSIFLLFKVGLHSEVSKIFNRKNFFVAFLGVVVPFLGGYLYATYTGHGFAYAIFLGAALTATSVGVTAAVLEEFKIIDREFAQVILGAAVIDDILGLMVLSFAQNVSVATSADSLFPLLSVLAIAIVFVLGSIKLGQYIVGRYFNECCSENGKIPKTTFIAILIFALSYSYTAEFIGLSAIVGAFIAGVTLNYSKSINKIIEMVYPLEVFFVPIFFISLGMMVDLNALTQSVWPIVVVTIIAILTKIIGCGLAAKTGGLNWRDSFIIGLGMMPRGEVALIIGFYGLSATILTQNEYSVIASMAFLTTIIMPPILSRLLKK